MNKSADNCYIIDKEINGVAVSCWIKRNGQESVLIILSKSDYNEANRPRGRINFIANAYKMITGIKTIVIEPGDKLNLK